MTAVLVAACGLIGTRLSMSHVVAGVGVALVLTHFPAILLPILISVLVVAGRRRLRMRTEADRIRREDTATLAELTAIGLTGGLGLQPALALAADALGGPIGTEAEAVLRQVRVGGAVTLATAGGSGGDLYRTMGRAAASGASLLGPVTRLADDLHAELATIRLQAVRRLPVTMLFPLTLLILPGFLLLTVAPAVLEGFSRLDL